METQNPFIIPIAIIIAGAIIGGAIFYSTKTRDTGQVAQQDATTKTKPVSAVTSKDHIRGNPEGAITVIEYSDLQCPYCQSFHTTMARVIGEAEDVRWVYRHFPLTQIHANALPAAIASECVARLAGNAAFWIFTDRVFQDQASMGNAQYVSFAKDLGIAQDNFTACLADTSLADKVNAQTQEAIESGGRGTPYNVVITASGKQAPFSGALPYATVQQILDQARKN